jgi:hypothetical protein
MEQYIAQLNENNIVIDVHVVTTEFMAANPTRYTGVWVETFYDLPNKQYAAIGYTYSYDTQNFMPTVIEPIEPADEP